MYSRIAWTLFAATFAALLWFGCDDEDEPEPPPHGLPTVQIVPEIHNDTLRFFTEDSVYFAITIIVINSQGRAYPGQKVDITLSDPSLGVLEYVDPLLRDTSNALGRVNCRFYAHAQAGEQTITASAGGLVDTLAMTLIEVARPLSGFTLTSDRPHDTIYVAPDSELVIHFTAYFADGSGNPRTEFNGMFISSSATGGQLERFTVFANGLSTSTWSFLNQYGTFQARIFGNWLDPFTMLPDTTD